MTKTSENAHSTNVANFETLVSAVSNLGASYNPAKDSLKLPALQSLLGIAKRTSLTHQQALTAYEVAVDAREMAFQPTGKLFTRVNNTLKASDSSMKNDETAQTIFRKLQGRRASAKLTDEEKAALQAEGKEVNQISASHMGYVSQVENLSRLITLLQAIPAYNPNEEDLKITALQALLTDLQAKNTDVTNTSIQLGSTRAARNEVLYKPLVGLVDIATDVKTYIKAAFGTSSTQYKQISKLAFLLHD